MISRARPLVAATGATDLTSNKGYTVTLGVTASVFTATLSASATVPATGVVVDGGTTSNTSTIAILGAGAVVWMKTSGAITAGARVQQAADGTIVTDAGAGSARVVVGVALQTAVSGDLIEVATIAPMILP